MKLLKLFAVVILFAVVTNAQENIKLITYGNEAKKLEGDNDYLQVLFIKIDASASDSVFYVNVFDADCGGINDQAYSSFNSSFTYSLLGGMGAFSGYSPDAEKSQLPNMAGSLIEKKELGEDDFYNNRWREIFSFNKKDGELTDGSYYFRLEVKGNGGDDANIYDVAVATSKNSPFNSGSVKVFSYFPTIRLAEFEKSAGLVLGTNKNSATVTANGFDIDKAEIKFITPFRTLDVNNNGLQGKWNQVSVNIDELESGKNLQFYFGQGGESPNDATFYFNDQSGKYLPVYLPIKQVVVNNRPVIKYSWTPLADCYSVVLDAKGTFDPDNHGLRYTWVLGDGSTKNGSRVQYSYKEKGLYNASLIVEDQSGEIGNSSIEHFVIKINETPVAKAGEDVVSSPGKVINFDAGESYDPDGKITKYQWEYGDGEVEFGATATHVYKTPGTYNVRLTVTDDSNSPCNTDVELKTVRINAAPVAAANLVKVSAPGENITFDASRSYDPDDQIVKYYWNFKDGETAEGKTVTHSFTNPGKYEVQLIVHDASNVFNSADSTIVPVVINAAPVAKAGIDKLVAVDEIIVFNGEGSIDSDGRIINYDWNFGDGAMKQGLSVAHSYTNPGTYKVTLNVKDNSNTLENESLDSLTVVVNARPNAEAGDDVYQTYGRVKFDGSKSTDTDGELVEYVWDFGDGEKGFGPEPTHIYTAPGEYVVRLKVTDNTPTANNFHEDAMHVKINRLPLADAGPDLTSAPGQTVTLDGGSSFDPDGSITKYEWLTGDGERLEGAVVDYTYKKPGTYTVTLIVTDNSGHEIAYDIDNKIVVVNSEPVAIAGSDFSVAPDDEIVFKANASYDIDGEIEEYLWEFSDGDNSQDVEYTKSFDEPGIYFAYLRVKDNSQDINTFAYDTAKIVVNSQPIAVAGKNIDQCGTYVKFSGKASTDPDGDALVYEWDFGDGSPVKFGADVEHNYEAGGIYPVRLKVTDSKNLKNSVSTSALSVKINKAPVANAGDDRVLCAGENNIFTAEGSFDPEGGVLKYFWDFGDGTTAEGINPTKIYPEGGVYQVSLRVEDNSNLGCNFDVDNILIEVVESPVANAGEDMIVCANTEVKFDGTKSTDNDGVVDAFEWDFGDGGTGGGPTPTYIYEKAGTYRVTLTITGDITKGCDNSDTDEITIKVIEAPVAQITCDEIFPVNQSMEFSADNSSGEGADIIKYSWDFGDGTTANGSDVEHTFKKYGSYIVTLTINTDSETDCNMAVAQKRIIINEKPNAEAGMDIIASTNSEILFNGVNSGDIDGALKEYIWDFADGKIDTGVIVSHEFNTSGIYNVLLKVVDGTSLNNNYDYDTVKVTVNEAPKPDFIIPTVWCLGEELKLDATRSNDSDGSITAYSWDMGDGSVLQGKNVSYTYNKSGTYVINLTVKDDRNVENSTVTLGKKIKINNGPVAIAGKSLVVAPGEEIVFDGSKSYDLDDMLSEYNWQFGDGDSEEGAVIKHTYSSPGVYSVKLTVNDNSGSECAKSEDIISVKVNSAPVAVVEIPNDVKTGPANNYIVLSAEKSHDGDNDALSYEWQLPDGDIKRGVKIKYVPVGTEPVSIKLIVNDSQGVSNSISEEIITVNPENWK